MRAPTFWQAKRRSTELALLVQAARVYSEKAIEEAEKEGCGVTEGELADHKYKMGRALWALGGDFNNDPKQCRSFLEEASEEEHDSQVGVIGSYNSYL